MLEKPVNKEDAAVALEVAVRAGAVEAIDEVAAGADPRHSFLRSAWFGASAASSVSTLVAARADGRAVAAIPVTPTGPAIAGMRAVPGFYWPFRSFPIAADASDAELRVLLSDRTARTALGRAWRLGPVYEDDPTAERLARIALRAGWTILTKRLGTTYRLDIDALEAEGSWPRTSTLRKNRWIERRLAEIGELEWTNVSGAGWNKQVFDTLAEIERNSWVCRNGDGKDAKFAAPHNRAFWEKALADPQIAAMASAAILHIGGVPAAFALSIHTGRTRFYLANSYDERFAKHSLGRALLYRDFQQAIEAGAREIGWGSGDSGYKTEMGATPGPEILDLLFVRSRPVAMALRPFWRG